MKDKIINLKIEICCQFMWRRIPMDTALKEAEVSTRWQIQDYQTNTKKIVKIQSSAFRIQKQ